MCNTCNCAFQSYWVRSINLYFTNGFCFVERLNSMFLWSTAGKSQESKQSPWLVLWYNTFPPSLLTHWWGTGCWKDDGRCGTVPGKASRGKSKRTLSKAGSWLSLLQSFRFPTTGPASSCWLPQSSPSSCELALSSRNGPGVTNRFSVWDPQLHDLGGWEGEGATSSSWKQNGVKA